jgi:hypothetical protein
MTIPAISSPRRSSASAVTRNTWALSSASPVRWVALATSTAKPLVIANATSVPPSATVVPSLNPCAR